MRIIGYSFEADIHCSACTEHKAAIGVLKRQPPLNPKPDEHGIAQDLVDREGNSVHPIFRTDEIDEDSACGDCYEPIY